MLFISSLSLLTRISLAFFILEAVFFGIFHDVSETITVITEGIEITYERCDNTVFYPTIPSVYKYILIYIYYSY